MVEICIWSRCRFSWHLDSLMKSAQPLKQGSVLLDRRKLRWIHEVRTSIHHYRAALCTSTGRKSACKEMTIRIRSSYNHYMDTREKKQRPCPNVLEFHCPFIFLTSQKTHFFIYPKRMMDNGQELAIHKRRNTNRTHTYMKIYSTYQS